MGYIFKKIGSRHKGNIIMKAMISFIVSIMLITCVESDAKVGAKEIPDESAGASFSIACPAFENGADIPAIFTCTGSDYSPALQWENTPEGTKSFALIVDDPDAPVGTFTHWVLFNIPSGLASLSEKASPHGTPPAGTREGINDFGKNGYGGPCPPPGKPHRYFFKLYALDSTVNLPVGATKDQLIQSMKGHILGQTQLMGMFAR
jgi:Raf kinase inhibitor-like YbhB/YbcL family protein